MPEVTKYEPGTPCWVDLATTDLAGARKFYGAVLGWKDFSEGPEEAGFYTMPERGGKPLAGMATQQEAEKQMGVPPHWNSYISVKSSDDTTKKAAGLGGTVVLEPMDVLDVGRMSVILDPEGAAICTWEPRAHPGAAIVNEPGAWCWNELYAKDTEKAKAFYSGLFGWGSHTSAEPMEYTEWQVGDKTIGGMMRLTDEMGPMPPNWLVYFAVDDAAATIEKAKSSGGNVLMGPMDIPSVGTIAVIADPQGAVFAVIKTAMEH